ncbi:hypothetical protein [Chryseobacterium culicis]|uniref:Uncharacterized protein n=1 Tax=Chryseobacterium culicis TaxID=680127 RepID=A0A1H6HKS6_CHRCI|nr:hypothetical protein [Chryseobacterium culicis]SEH34690.1 hypothetical protein SAMN05421593_2700 [Chryseobacterium culicis]
MLASFSALLYFIIGAVAMDKGVGKLHYSNSLKEAEKEKTLINKYFVYDVNGKETSNAWLEYARSYNVFNNKKIKQNKISLRITTVKEFEGIKDVYWEAFFKNKKLTAFEDKGIISGVGVEKTMDTIILKPNREKVFYVVLDK